MNDVTVPTVGSKSINEWINEAKARPVPKGLFGDLWLEGEMAVMFADTGMGKSVLALQIAESIARGRAVQPFDRNAPQQRVQYFDLELSDKQLEMRYSAEADRGKRLKNHYKFSDRLRRIKMDPNEPLQDGHRSFDEYLIRKIKEEVQATGARVVVVDNISHVYRSYEGTRHAVRLMNRLNGLKSTYGLSILVLAHTRKRAGSRTLTVGEVQSSRALACLADSVFAIGQTTGDPTFRYLKHLKSRSTEMVLDESCVPMFRITKLNRNFLGFEFQSFTTESEQTREPPETYDAEWVNFMKQLSDSGMTIREIAHEFDYSKSTVHRMLHLPEPKREAAVLKPSAPSPGSSRQSEPVPTVAVDGLTQAIGISGSTTQLELPPEGGTQNPSDLPPEVADGYADECEPPDEECDARHTDGYPDSVVSKPIRRKKDSVGVGESGEGEETPPPDLEAAPAPLPITDHHPPLTVKLDAAGDEIYIEKEDECGRPVIWYKVEGRTIFRRVRSTTGIWCEVVDEIPNGPRLDRVVMNFY